MGALLGVMVGGIAVAALALSKRARNAPSPSQDSAPPPQASNPPDSDNGGGGAELLALAGGGGIVAAGLALTAAGGELGEQLTGDSAGRLAGYANWASGNVFNAGRVGGKAIDRALGGDGTSATGAIAQVGGGVALTTGTILGALATVSFATFAALVYAIGSVVEDLNRLSYGQSGALRDFNSRWRTVQGALFGALRDLGLDEAQALAISYPYTDGYMCEQNRNAFAQWMRRGKGFIGTGLGSSDAYHARFGRDRGYFVGEPIVEGSAVRGVADPPRWTAQDAEFWRIASRGNLRPYPENRADLWDYQLPDEELLGETLLYAPFARGVIQANVDAYLAWMREPRGFGVSELLHFQVGLEEGRFRGEHAGEARLRWAALTDDGQQVPAVYDSTAVTKDVPTGRVA